MRGDQIQMTVIQIDNYGPWTDTLGNDREHRLQVLQAELYSSFQEKFAKREGLVFFNRFDEMLAVTNGISREQHREIQIEINNQFPFTVSMGVGVGRTAFDAQVNASKLLQKTGSAQSEIRKAEFACATTLDGNESCVQIIHIDIDRITETSTDHASAFETSIKVMTVYADLMRSLKDHQALLFYIGGDNFMGVANGVSVDTITSLLKDYHDSNIELKCGIGIAKTGRKAAELATTNLHKIRQDRNNFILATTHM
ncbi:MAG TPA: GTP cyclohydrolase IIa [Candidatus Bathyarchaeia archaeon]|nr:GTP cyclohydrolase IIa [Candidatus Bathyarchaeia archaeon]